MQLPEQLAVQIVGAHALRPRGHELRSQVVLPDERRRPVLALLVALDLPHLLAGVLVEGGEERAGGVVVDDVQPVVVEDRRRGGPHLQQRVVDVELPGPDGLAAHVERGDLADGPEVDVHAPPVGDRRLRREAVLQMPLAGRRRAVELALPPGAAGVEVDGIEQPAMRVQRGLRPVLHARVVQTLDRLGLVAGADRGGQEDVVARDHRRAPGQSRNIDGPDDVIGLAPVLRQIRIVGDDARGRSPELQPVFLPRGRGSGDQQRAYRDDDDPVHRFSPSTLRPGPVPACALPRCGCRSDGSRHRANECRACP